MSLAPTPLARLALAQVDGAPASVDDAALVRAVVEGHASAPGLVFDRYAALVHGILRRSLGPGADVDDQVQVAFVELFREAKNLRDPSVLRSFLIGITVRVARAELRRRRTAAGSASPTTAPCPRSRSKATRRARGARASLRDAGAARHSSRMLFVLRHVEGSSSPRRPRPWAGRWPRPSAI